MHKRRIVGHIPLLWIASFFLVSATVNSDTLPSTNPLSTPSSPSLTVSCAPEQPVAHPGEQMIVRTWVTDAAGKTLVQTPRFTWSVSAGNVSGSDTATWTLDNPTLDAYGVLRVTAKVLVQDPLVGQGSCEVWIVVAKRPTIKSTPDRSGRASGRVLLLRDHPEPKGYGLYSYLLFDTPPKDDQERERYLKALESYLRILQPIAELEHDQRRSELNITLIPVKKNVELPADLSSTERASPAAKQVLAAYDYARASVLLAKLDRQDMQSGPFLMSLRSTAASPDAIFLFFDMSHVTPNLVWDWVKRFCSLAAQERTWSEIALAQLVLNMRNVIAVTAKMMPDVLGVPQQGIRIVKVHDGR